MSLIYSTRELMFLDKIKYPEINIEKSEFAFIIGASGCGKSSYLKLLNRTELYTSGKIYYSQKEIKTLPVLEYRKKVMLVPQNEFLIDGTIKDNFRFYYESTNKEMIDDKEINKYLKVCCLDFDALKPCDNLSGGERQRVFISIFLSCKPNVLLLDEPTSALDEKTSEKLIENLKNFSRENEITVICVCHNKALVKKFSDNTILLGEKV